MSDHLSQATVHFTNRSPADSLDAKITFGGDLRPGSPAGGPGPATGTAFLAQLYGGAPGGTLRPLGAPLGFREGPGAGYLKPSADVVRYVTDVPASGSAQVQIKAWAACLGASFEEAQAQGVGGTGESFPVIVRTGGGISPPLAPAGLMGFEIAAIRG